MFDEKQSILRLARRHATIRYRNRADGGRTLLERLRHANASYDVVVFIPRGGAEISYEIATELRVRHHVPCPVVKIPSFFDDRFGIGALMESGEPILNPDACAAFGLEQPSTAELVDQAFRRQTEFKAQLRHHPDTLSVVRDKRVLVVDDTLASGYTMLAAVRSVRSHLPSAIDFAVPLASASGTTLVEREHVRAIIPFVEHAPIFLADEYYEEFPAVGMDRVLQLMGEYGKHDFAWMNP